MIRFSKYWIEKDRTKGGVSKIDMCIKCRRHIASSYVSLDGHSARNAQKETHIYGTISSAWIYARRIWRDY